MTDKKVAQCQAVSLSGQRCDLPANGHALHKCHTDVRSSQITFTRTTRGGTSKLWQS